MRYVALTILFMVGVLAATVLTQLSHDKPLCVQGSVIHLLIDCQVMR
jgi:hypothetical protein